MLPELLANLLMYWPYDVHRYTRSLRDRWVPLVALAGPVLCYVIDYNQKSLFGSYRLGLELLILNGLLVFAGLLLISKPRQ